MNNFIKINAYRNYMNALDNLAEAWEGLFWHAGEVARLDAQYRPDLIPILEGVKELREVASGKLNQLELNEVASDF